MDVREGRLSALQPIIQTFVSRHWTGRSWRHVGNVAWARCAIPAEADPPAAVWMVNGETSAAAWVEDGNSLEWVTTEQPEVVRHVINWFVDRFTARPLFATVLEHQAMVLGVLRDQGFIPDAGGPYFVHMWRSLTDLPAIGPLPEGFHARSMRGPADLEARVAVHRAAWHPSGMTVDRYRALMADAAYRSAFDWVIEEPGGDFAAAALLWVDPAHQAGLLEPVGTDPRYRRRGLSRAVCLAALHELRRQGGVQAVVQPRGDDDYPVPYRLYRGLGFMPVTRTVTFRRET